MQKYNSLKKEQILRLTCYEAYPTVCFKTLVKVHRQPNFVVFSLHLYPKGIEFFLYQQIVRLPSVNWAEIEAYRTKKSILWAHLNKLTWALPFLSVHSSYFHDSLYFMLLEPILRLTWTFFKKGLILMIGEF